MSKTITITVTKGGTISVEAGGFQGQGCEALVVAIAGRLGGRELLSAHTAEWYTADQTPERGQEVQR